MLIGAHVSTAGGLVKAHERGVEIGAAAIQIWGQSPRMWKPTSWKDDDVAAFGELMDGGPIEAVVIHAIYLINCASKDKEIRPQVDRLAGALAAHGRPDRRGRRGAASGIDRRRAARRRRSKRVGEALRQALEESDSCPLLLEDTAGAGNTLGRTFEELAELIDLAGGHKRLGLCLDSCHLLASGFDIRTAEGLDEVIDQLRGDRRHGAAALPARERLPDATRLQPRPPCAAGRGRAGQEGMRGLPLGAALRGPAGDLRGPRHGRQGADREGHEAREAAAERRA